MIVASCDTNNQIDPQLLRTCNFFHFREMIAIPKMNDFIFRRRLFHTSWYSRRMALTRIKNFLEAGKQFNSTLTETDLSIQRDWVALFGNKSQLATQLAAEARYLPPNQHHKHHEKYAYITFLAQTRLAGDLGDAVEDKELSEAYAYLERNTKEVSQSWGSYWLERADQKFGPLFYAPSEDAADKFALEVAAALTEMSAKHVGLLALGFIDRDESMFESKNVEKERGLVSEIFELIKRQNRQTEDIDVEQSTLEEWAPPTLL